MKKWRVSAGYNSKKSSRRTIKAMRVAQLLELNLHHQHQGSYFVTAAAAEKNNNNEEGSDCLILMSCCESRPTHDWNLFFL